MRNPGSLADSIRAFYFEGNGEHTLILWNTLVVIPRKIKVTLPGTNQKLWNVVTDKPVLIDGEDANVYTLSENAENNLLFFTWQNNDTSTPPRVSTP